MPENTTRLTFDAARGLVLPCFKDYMHQQAYQIKLSGLKEESFTLLLARPNFNEAQSSARKR